MENTSEYETVATVGVDRELCQSAAICLAYNIYELDDEAKAVLLTQNGSNSDDPKNPMVIGDGYVKIEDLVNPDGEDMASIQEKVLRSAQECPFNAIIVKDKDGNQLWPLE